MVYSYIRIDIEVAIVEVNLSLPSQSQLDAEHPTVIPMDISTSPTTPLGPMTRARAKAIKDKVNSLLSELPLSTYETWLLPQEETLCVIRYLEEGHGLAMPNGQGGKDTKYNDQEEELPGIYNHWTTGTCRTSDAWELQLASRVPACACSSGRTTDTD